MGAPVKPQVNASNVPAAAKGEVKKGGGGTVGAKGAKDGAKPASAAAHKTPAPPQIIALRGSSMSDAELTRYLNGYPDKGGSAVETLSKIKEMSKVADGFDGKVEEVVARRMRRRSLRASKRPSRILLRSMRAQRSSSRISKRLSRLSDRSKPTRKRRRKQNPRLLQPQAERLRPHRQLYRQLHPPAPKTAADAWKNAKVQKPLSPRAVSKVKNAAGYVVTQTNLLVNQLASSKAEQMGRLKTVIEEKKLGTRMAFGKIDVGAGILVELRKGIAPVTMAMGIVSNGSPTAAQELKGQAGTVKSNAATVDQLAIHAHDALNEEFKTTYEAVAQSSKQNTPFDFLG